MSVSTIQPIRAIANESKQLTPHQGSYRGHQIDYFGLDTTVILHASKTWIRGIRPPDYRANKLASYSTTRARVRAVLLLARKRSSESMAIAFTSRTDTRGIIVS